MARARRTQVVDPDPNAQPPGEPPDGYDDLPDQDDADDFDFLSDSDVTYIVQRYKTSDEIAREPRGKSRVFVTKIPAPLELDLLHREHGGGRYRILKQDTGGRLLGSREIELEGPARIRVPEPPPSPAPVATPAVATEDPRRRAERRALKRLLREVGELKTRAAQPVSLPVPYAGSNFDQVAQVLALADKLAARNAPAAGPVDAVINALMKGIDLGTQREPAPAAAGTDWISLAKEAVPLVRDFLQTAAASARARAASSGPPRPATAGQPAPTATTPGNPSIPYADVVPEPSHEDQMKVARWTTVVDSLARAVARNVDPADFADTLRDLLPDEDIATLRFAPLDRIAAELSAGASHYPLLATPEGVLHPPARAFLEAVHAALIAGPDSDAE